MKWWKMLRESSKNEEELKIFEREKLFYQKLSKHLIWEKVMKSIKILQNFTALNLLINFNSHIKYKSNVQYHFSLRGDDLFLKKGERIRL